MIVTLTANPSIDKTVVVDRLEPGKSIYARDASQIGAGKGINVSRLVHTLGGETLAIWLCGGWTGRRLQALLAEEGLPNRAIRIAGELRTAITIRDLGAAAASTRIFEPGPALSPHEITRIVATVMRILKPHDILVLSGSVPSPSADGLYAGLIESARRRGAMTALDTRDDALLRGLAARPYLVKANQDEAALVLGAAVTGFASAFAATDAILAQGATIAVVSLGPAGAVLVGNGEGWLAQSPPVNVASPVGSGDSMLAAIAYGITLGLPVAELLRIGVAAGAANAEVWNPAACGRADVERLAAQVTLLPRPS